MDNKFKLTACLSIALFYLSVAESLHASKPDHYDSPLESLSALLNIDQLSIASRLPELPPLRVISERAPDGLDLIVSLSDASDPAHSATMAAKTADAKVHSPLSNQQVVAMDSAFTSDSKGEIAGWHPIEAAAQTEEAQTDLKVPATLTSAKQSLLKLLTINISPAANIPAAGTLTENREDRDSNPIQARSQASAVIYNRVTDTDNTTAGGWRDKLGNLLLAGYKTLTGIKARESSQPDAGVALLNSASNNDETNGLAADSANHVLAIDPEDVVEGSSKKARTMVSSEVSPAASLTNSADDLTPPEVTHKQNPIEKVLPAYRASIDAPEMDVLEIDANLNTATDIAVASAVKPEPAESLEAASERANLLASKYFASRLPIKQFPYPLFRIKSSPLLDSAGEQNADADTDALNFDKVLSPNQQTTASHTQPDSAAAADSGFLHPPGHKPLVIMLDAGHGGHDSGTVGPGGLYEKNLTMDIARRIEILASLHSDIEVRMTRTSDSSMSRTERLDNAKQGDADLLLSIHLNHIPQPDVILVETYFASQQDVLESNRIAGKRAAQKKMLKVTNVTDTEGAVDQATQQSRAAVSKAFARTLQSEVFATVQRSNPRAIDAGVKSEALYMLTRSQIPAALIELTCLSNPAEELRLSTERYRVSLAESLMRAIRKFADERQLRDAV